jgi:hypothetical protein
MSTIQELAARRAELEAQLSEVKQEIAARAGEAHEPDADTEPASTPTPGPVAGPEETLGTPADGTVTVPAPEETPGTPEG